MKSEKGQSLVEFALVLPVLVLLVIAIYDFSLFFHAYLTIDHAGRETARMVSVEKNKRTLTEVEIKTFAKEIASGLNKDDLTVDVSYEEGSTEEIEIVNITISCPVQFYFPIIGAIYNKDITHPTAILITLKDTTKMRVE